MSLRSMNHEDDKQLFPKKKPSASKSVSSISSLIWIGASAFGLSAVIIWGRMPLTLAAASSIGLVAVLVLATINSRAKILFLFFINSCILVVRQRELGDADIAALFSLVAVLLAISGFGSNEQYPNSKVIQTPEKKGPDAVSILLVGFAALSIVSTTTNSQSLITLLPWINGIALALLIRRVPFSQLPSFSTVRRAILVAGAIAITYDLYLLVTGKSVNTSTFNAGRFQGSLGDYELLAEFYGAIILLSLTAMFFDKNRLWQIASGALIVPSFLVVLATQSRGPIVVLGVVVPIFIVVSALLFRELAGVILLLVGAVSLAVVLFGAVLSSTPLFERILSVQFDGSLESILNRAGVWDYFTQLPKFVNLGLVGNGFNYPYVDIGTYPHSLYLWLLWSGGVLTLTCFALLALLLLVKLARGFSLRRSASLSAFAVLVYLLLDEVKIEAARTSPTICFLWAAVALAILASREQGEM